MKKIFFIPLFFIVQMAFSQATDKATNLFTVAGRVKNEKQITIADLKRFQAVELSNINTSCSPKREEKTKSVKAVLLKNVMDSVKFDYDQSHKLGQFYFVFVALDGYKIVFSYNEVFNTEVGNHLYIVTEMDGVKIEDMESRIMLLSTKDIKGGLEKCEGANIYCGILCRIKTVDGHFYLSNVLQTAF